MRNSNLFSALLVGLFVGFGLACERAVAQGRAARRMFEMITSAQPAFTVGTAVAQPGTKAFGQLQVPAGADAGLIMPVAVVNSGKPGPVLAFVAGSHGTEYASIVALQRLAQQIDPKQISGVVIIAPLLNIASIEQMKVHTNPTDQKGMNAQYPGNLNGTQTERALSIVAGQIVKHADVIVDLHGGDLDEDLTPYSYWIRGGNAQQDEASLKLIRAFGIPKIIVRDVDLTDPASTRNLSGYAMSVGKTAVVAEAGFSGTVTAADVNMLLDGCYNVMASLGMIKRAVRPVRSPVWLGSGSRIAAEAPGMFFASVRGGARVRKGAKLGFITDYAGRTTGEILSPLDGIVTFIRGVPSMWKGATIVNVSPVYPAPPKYVRPSR